VFAGAGLGCAAWALVPQAIAPTWVAYADKLAAGGDSVIARLSQHEIARGLEALRQCDAGPEEPPVVELIDLFVFRERSPGVLYQTV